MNEKTAQQKHFILTRDLIPIDVNENSCNFMCPLPKGSKELIERSFNLGLLAFKSDCIPIADRINEKAKKQLPPFQNILLGYHDRTKKEQEALLKNFKITKINFDKRGVYAILAGNDVTSGDAYLGTGFNC